jgi:hypothetical protein
MTTPSPAAVAKDPEKFASMFLRILDKKKKLRRFEWNAAQRDFHTKRTGRDLILKARQLGFSTYIQGEMFRRSVTGTRTTMTMAHDSETTQKLRRMADRFWENCKFGNLQPARKYANASLSSYPEFDSTSIIATAGNEEAGRGDTYTDFHGSEVAFWPDAERIMAGAMQGGNPDVILESTPNGAGGYFYDLCMEAIDGDGVWKLHFYPWWWDGAYSIELDKGEVIEFTAEEKDLAEKHSLTQEQIKWRRLKQKELKGLFIQEYPEDPISCFLTSGNSYFGDMADVFAAPPNAQYISGHRYEAGLDFAQDADYTSLTVLDITENQQVDKLHINHLGWGEQRARIAAIYKKWNLNKLLAEKNSIGSVNIEELQKLGLNVVPFDTTNASKAEIMSNLHEAFHGGGLKLLNDETYKAEFRTFVSIRLPSGLWRLAAAGSGHDDTVISTALAWEAANFPGWKDVDGLGSVEGYENRWR